VQKTENFDDWEVLITEGTILLLCDDLCPEMTGVGVYPHSSEIVLHVKDTLTTCQLEEYAACVRRKCIGIDGIQIVRGPDFGEGIELQKVIKPNPFCLPCYCICGSFRCLFSCGA